MKPSHRLIALGLAIVAAATGVILVTTAQAMDDTSLAGSTLANVTDDSNPALEYHGTWTSSEFVVGAVQMTQHQTTVPGSGLTYTFTGDFVGVLTEKGPRYGKVQITLDGESQGVFDLYDPYGWHLHEVWSADVQLGTHTVEIDAVHDKNAVSSGYGFTLDAFTSQPNWGITIARFEEKAYELEVITDANGEVTASWTAPEGYHIFDLHELRIYDADGTLPDVAPGVNFSLWQADYWGLEPETTYDVHVRLWLTQMQE